MSSDEEDVRDADSCGYGEILAQFTKWSIIDEKIISEKSCYALHIAAEKSFSKAAAGTSQGSVQVCQITPAQIINTAALKIECNAKESISGIEFAKDNANLLYVASTQGVVDVFDLRKNENIFTFFDRVNEKRIPITCFDINANDRIVCAGSEKICNDAYLIFFDARQRKRLGTYFESHEDDVTSVQFHPMHPDHLISGSTDGLINIFDISKSTEDDALSTVINSESSVQKLNWHRQDDSKYVISCITHTDEMKLYDSEEGDLIYEHSRDDISDAIRRKKADFCSLINCHSKNDGSIFLLAGSNYKDNVLRSVLVNRDNLQPFGNYEGNKQIVRASVTNENANMMLTTGESATINLWHEIPEIKNEHFKVKSKQKSHNKKPYEK